MNDMHMPTMRCIIVLSCVRDGVWYSSSRFCDEAHNIVKPREDVMNRDLRAKVKQFGERIRKAKNSVVVLFTATPIVNDPKDADDL